MVERNLRESVLHLARGIGSERRGIQRQQNGETQK